MLLKALDDPGLSLGEVLQRYMDAGSGNEKSAAWKPTSLASRLGMDRRSITDYMKDRSTPPLKFNTFGKITDCTFGRLMQTLGIASFNGGVFEPIERREAEFKGFLEKHRRATESTPEAEDGLSRFLAWRRMDFEGGTLWNFVPLRLMPAVSYDSPQQTTDQRPSASTFDSVSALLDSDKAAPFWILLGEPGSGKSTLLRAHEYRCLSERAAAKPELCLLFGLNAYTAESRLDPWDWVQHRWAQQWSSKWGLQPSLPELQTSYRLRLLFDGLNEIAADNPEARHGAVARFMEFAEDAVPKRGLLPPVFTVRTLNYTTTSSQHHRAPRHAMVDSLDRERIQRFIEQHFSTKNHPLWIALSNDESLRHLKLQELFGNPFNLRTQCTIYTRRTSGEKAEEQIARHATLRNRADLIAAMLWDRIRDQISRRPPPHWAFVDTLLTEDDRYLVASLAFGEIALGRSMRMNCGLIDGIDRLAYGVHLRHSGSRGRFSPTDAKNALGHPLAAELWWEALKALNVVRRVADTPGQNEFEFTHQLVQEFFAARWLANGASDEKLKTELNASVDLLGGTASPWEECVKMAAQLSADPAKVIATLIEANSFALAARTIKHLDDFVDTRSYRAVVAGQLFKKMQHASPPHPGSFSAAEALGTLGDSIRYQDAAGEHGRFLVPKAQYWGWIEPGTYPLGQIPTPTVIEAGFRIAYASVTNAEFACFVESGGYGLEAGGIAPASPPAWWQGDAAVTYWREQWRSNSHDGRSKAGRLSSPDSWGSAGNSNGLYPVTGVSFYEAQAYCCWLSAQTGKTVRLPTDVEWEAAARGIEGRPWPWGDGAPSDGAIDSRRLGLPSFPASPVALDVARSTPGGLFDLSGFMWQWTNSVFDPSEKFIDPDMKVCGARPDVRRRENPGRRHGQLGFRIVMID
ncbi:SUMF1/EgtB/PvdO family nonheme iron enzyme [Roseateles sp. DC23W]|uniref:SUMF1/EgtB/PvdO family nonheme iron enzyme n=1 Tax=Pelomonas dachongensis TaxID=3299029 RepID=UPI00374A3440